MSREILLKYQTNSKQIDGILSFVVIVIETAGGSLAVLLSKLNQGTRKNYLETLKFVYKGSFREFSFLSF